MDFLSSFKLQKRYNKMEIIQSSWIMWYWLNLTFVSIVSFLCSGFTYQHFITMKMQGEHKPRRKMESSGSPFASQEPRVVTSVWRVPQNCTYGKNNVIYLIGNPLHGFKQEKVFGRQSGRLFYKKIVMSKITLHKKIKQVHSGCVVQWHCWYFFKLCKAIN